MSYDHNIDNKGKINKFEQNCQMMNRTLYKDTKIKCYIFMSVLVLLYGSESYIPLDKGEVQSAGSWQSGNIQSELYSANLTELRRTE